MIERVGMLGVGGESCVVRFRFSDPGMYGHNQRRSMSRDAIDAFMRAEGTSVEVVSVRGGKRRGTRALREGGWVMITEL